MPTETILITVTGANPQTKTVAINVDPTTGSGSTSVTFTGANGGQDQFVASATIANNSYTSNSAFMGWQPTNGAVSLVSNLTIAGYTNPGETATWHGAGTLYSTLANKNSVVVNQVYTNGAVGNGVPITGLVTNDGNSGQYAHQPPLLDDVKSDGTALTSLGSVLGWGLGAAGDGSFVTFFQGQIVVAAAGIQTFYMLVDDSWALYIGGGATRVAGAFTTVPNGSSPASPSTADQAVVGTSLTGVGTWPLMGTRNTAAIAVQPSDYVYANFPTPGIYPFLAWWVNNASAQTYFQMTFASGSAAIPPSSGNGESGGVVKPVALQAAPPATTPAGHLQLSLAQSNVQIQGNQITLNVSVNGIVYTTKQYIPLLEGTVGKLFIYNDPSHVFNFQNYNGTTPSNTAAAPSVFTLSGNTQSLLSVQYNQAGDNSFSLFYGGGQFPAGIAASTQLTVTAEDIGWYTTTKGFDLFSPASVGGPGGISFSVEVDYMVSPSGFAVSPNSVQADGLQHIFTVTLSQPMSPQQIGANGITQNSVAATFTSNGGTTIATGSITPNFNTSGFLTGYSVPITVPKSTANGTFQIALTLTGILDYLNGTSFVIHGPVTYLSNISQTVSLVGLQFVAPVPYAFSISPSTTTLAPGGTVKLTGEVYTFDNNPVTMTFYYKNTTSGSPASAIGPGTLQSTTTGTVSGQIVYFSTFTYASFVPPGQGLNVNTDLLGYTATDTVSGLSVTYFSTTVYTFPLGTSCEPAFNTARLATTTDNTVVWTSFGQITLWQPNTVYQSFAPIYDPGSNSIYIMAQAGNRTSTSTRPNFTGIPALGQEGGSTGFVSEGGNDIKWQCMGVVGVNGALNQLWGPGVSFNSAPAPAGSNRPTNTASMIVYPIAPFLGTNGQICNGIPVYLIVATTAGKTHLCS